MLPFLLVALVANCYMLFWDIYMDWNLGRISSVNFFLRDKLIYPKWFYYMSITINSFLRFTWITSIVPVNINPEDLNFSLSILEIYRRGQWSLIRIENENTNNPEKYRTVFEIPELPLD